MCPRFRYDLTLSFTQSLRTLHMISEQNNPSNEILIESTSPETRRNPRHTNTFITIKLHLEHPDTYSNLVTQIPD